MRDGLVRLALGLASTYVLAAMGQSAAGGPPFPQTFASPEAAAHALAYAVKTNDAATLCSILGADAGLLLHSGDNVADAHDRLLFSAAYDQAHTLVVNRDHSETLLVGKEHWLIPLPLVKRGQGWMFDTQTGGEEVLRLRIGRNERSAVRVGQAIAAAERQYADLHRGDNSIPVYTVRLASSPGRHDGLYWPRREMEPASPLGPFLADAAEEGYHARGDSLFAPYHGYYYRILLRQDRVAKRDTQDDTVRGRTLGRFAVLAYPARYRVSGIMSFLVASDGVIYMKDLGKQTEKLAISMTSLDPDASWKRDQP